MTYGLAKLPDDLTADGNAFINSVQQLAGAAGTSIAATLVATAQNNDMANYSQSTATGCRHVFILLWVMLVLSLGCAWQMFALSPNRKRQTDISGQS